MTIDAGMIERIRGKKEKRKKEARRKARGERERERSVKGKYRADSPRGDPG